VTPNTNVLGAAGLGGAIAVVVVWLINSLLPAVPIPDPVAQAFVIIFTIACGYIIKPSYEGPEYYQRTGPQPEHSPPEPPPPRPSARARRSPAQRGRVD